jgi:hypothetical protein
MKRLFLIIGLSLMLIEGHSQADTLTGPTVYDYWNSGMTFTLQTGVWTPLGNLSKTLSSSPSIGLLVGLPITKRLRFDLGTTLFVPINSNRFSYRLPDTVLLARPSLVCGILGLWVTHTDQMKSKYFLDKILGIGLGFIQTDKTIDNPRSKQNTNHSLAAMNFGFGFNVRKVVLKRRSVGLNITYNFTPYSLFENHVERDFGSQSLWTGLIYKF